MLDTQLRVLEGGVRLVPGGRTCRWSTPRRRRSMAAATTFAKTPPTSARSMSTAGRSSCSTNGLPARREHDGSRRRPPLLQRLRAGRGAQGADGEHRPPLRPADRRRPARCACSAPRTVPATASTAATSSSSATWSRQTSGPSNPIGQRRLQSRHRQEPELQRPRPRRDRRTRRRPDRIHPDAGRPAGAYQAFTEADIARLRADGYEQPFLPIEDGVRRTLSAP